jgi:hypothetical protein
VGKENGSCRYRFRSEGFNSDETLNYRLTDPFGNIYIDTGVLGLPIGVDDAFGFLLGSQDQPGLWVVEFIGIEQTAIYVLQWTGQCPEQ